MTDPARTLTAGMSEGPSFMNSPLTENSRPEKALWYQEVLSLDPASRIFLPYARLLAESGRRMEAVEVLRAGLARHPEFLDARLLLIDLLHECGQDAAAGLEASGIIESLSRCSALWDIWSRLPGVRADQSAMLLFFGATFRKDGPSLADVFEAGMQALREKDREDSGKETFPAAETSSEAQDSGSAVTETFADASSDSTEKTGIIPDAPSAASAQKAPVSLPAPEQILTTNPAAPEPGQSASEAPEGSGPEDAHPRAFVMGENAPWYSLDAVPDDDDIFDEDEEAAAAPALPPSAMQLLFPDNSLPPADGDDGALEECTVPRTATEGKSSLCTRSMARILEEQGATGEAANIYRELLEVSSSAEERAELNAKLDSLMQGTENAAPEQPADSGLLNMLETLAVRLENKSRA